MLFGPIKMQITEFFEHQYRKDESFCRDFPVEGKVYKRWQSAQLSRFQNENPYYDEWPKVRDGLLRAFANNDLMLVRDCFWRSLIATEFHPDKLPAVVVWGMKRAASIAHNKIIYDLLNVKMSINAIRGESFYGDLPAVQEKDLELGRLLNKLDIYGENNE